MMNSTGVGSREKLELVGGGRRQAGWLRRRRMLLHALCSVIYRGRYWTPERDRGVRSDTIHMP